MKILKEGNPNDNVRVGSKRRTFFMVREPTKYHKDILKHLVDSLQT